MTAASHAEGVQMEVAASSLRVVALGGGHGLAGVLQALRSLTHNITAIVTVADNGGSSGRLRKEFPIIPPGDLRMALAALCSDDEWGRSWAQILQYRFTSSGPLDGHAVGNLLLAALWDRDEDPVLGLDRVGSLLKVIGRVLPMSDQPLDIEATFDTPLGERLIRGQVQVATTAGKLLSLQLRPHNPTPRPECLEAIEKADWITMGPGSWFSSVLPHVLAPAQLQAIATSQAKKILILNLDSADSPRADEYSGYSPTEHIKILQEYSHGLHFDFIIADSQAAREDSYLDGYCKSLGSELISRDLRKTGEVAHHDREKLISLFSHIAGKTLVG